MLWALILLMGQSMAGDVSVKGYTRADGTIVAPYHRSTPNSTPCDNYSAWGNVNPWTGDVGTLRHAECIGCNMPYVSVDPEVWVRPLVFHTPTQQQPSASDLDGDGLFGDEESKAKTNPSVSDTDGDGLNDGFEVILYGSNPLDPDSDDDGLTDGAEANSFGTHPMLADTDGDGLDDGVEALLNGTDPKNPDRRIIDFHTDFSTVGGVPLRKSFLLEARSSVNAIK